MHFLRNQKSALLPQDLEVAAQGTVFLMRQTDLHSGQRTSISWSKRVVSKGPLNNQPNLINRERGDPVESINIYESNVPLACSSPHARW